MSAEFIDLSSLSGLVHAALPAWVFEPESRAVVWANELAVEFWNSPSLEHLLARDTTDGAPEAVMLRTRLMHERVCAGEHLREEWVFYPKGRPTPVTLDVRGVALANGRVGLLCQALVAQGMTPEMQRAIVINRHAATISALVRANGELSSQNAAAQQAFPGARSWFAWLADPAQGQAALATALAGQRVQARFDVHVDGQLRWHFVDMHMLHDPVTAEDVVLVEHTDETARIEAEQRAGVLHETLMLVEQQRQAILSLSAPILDVGEQTLAVPIIGRLGAEQSESLTTRLLDAVADRRARRVILDLTGIAEIDQRSAGRLRELIAALRLLGAQATISGIRPELALALLDADVSLADIETARSLAEGLRRRQTQ
jgi:anti-anti-sigma regulatory factor